MRKGRCPAHVKQASRERGSATQRGYGSDWERVKNQKLQLLAGEALQDFRKANGCDPSAFCEDCKKVGRLTIATQVHHIIKFRYRPDLRLVMSNLMSLCGPCHALRTARGE